MKISRPELDAALLAFAREGHGLVLGTPGVGKTHSLGTLCRTLEARAISFLLLPVDQLGDATEDDLRLVLGYGEGVFIDRLRELFALPEGVLVFDGFDAARNADVRARVMQLIRAAMRSAPEHWSVVVSVRNYDAAKSPSLTELFGGAATRAPDRFRLPGVRARHFAVPELTTEEVRGAIDQIPGFARIYTLASDGLRRLVHTPFNLWLIERVMREVPDPATLGALESEAQLLSLYWTTYVTANADSELRTLVLRRAVDSMISERRITFQNTDVYSPDVDAAWRALLSAEVLSEVATGRHRAAFTHNILFDYAVSVLAIADAPGALTQFLTADASRPLFLRPSLVYYFIRLWQENRPRFWPCFWEVMGASSVPVRLVGRLIPPFVIAAECGDVAELAPLLERRALFPADGIAAVLRVLQALRFTEPRSPAVWVSFSERVARAPDCTFAWELSFVLDRSVDDESEGRDDRVRSVGASARELFEWAWARRVGEGGSWYDAFASLRALPLVMKTFGTNVPSGAVIVRRVLELLREAGFPIRYFNEVADGVKHMTPYAPDLVADVYKTLFAHEEASQEKTHMGGIVLPMLSNRRQDFSMVHYALAKAFPEYLRACPEHAIPVAFAVLNRFAVEHMRPYLREGKTVDDVTQRFRFLGADRPYIRDLSVSWRQVLRGEEKDIGDDVVRFLADPEASIEPRQAVALAVNHAAAATTWSILLEVGAELPAKYASTLYELALARPVQLGGDTVQALGTFVERAAAYWTAEQLAAFEEAVLALAPLDAISEETPEDEEYEARVRDRLLARIPRGLLVTAAARTRMELLSAKSAVPSNDPLVKFSSGWKDYGAGDWLADQGVNPQSPENAPLLALGEELGRFANEWTNKRPDQSAVVKAVASLSRAFGILAPFADAMLASASLPEVAPEQSREGTEASPSGDGSNESPPQGSGPVTPDPKVVVQAWSEVAAAARAVATARPDAASDGYRIARDILLRASVFPPPPVRPDAEDSFTTPGWGRTVRTEAVQGLGYLAELGGDRPVVDAFVAFARSTEPAERYLAVRHSLSLAGQWRDVFWQVLEERGAAERNPVVVAAVLDSVARARGAREARGIALLKTIVSTWTAGSPMQCERGSDLLEGIAGALVYLAFYRQDEWAVDVVRTATTGLPTSFVLLNALAHDAVNQLTPSTLTDPQGVAPAQRVAAWLLEALEACRRRVVAVRGDLGGTTPEQREEELSRLHKFVNSLVSGIYRNKRETESSDDGQVRQAKGAPERRDPERTARLLRAYYDAVAPILRGVLSFSDVASGAGGMVAGTAHYFMELLNEFLPLDPRGVVDMAASVATAGTATSYQLDPVAIREVVKLVEVLLVDHRDQIIAEKPLDDTLRLLDVFADAGWPEALRLVWRLDEVFR